MSNCVHDNGGCCEVFSDKEVRQPCFETPLCEDYKEIVRCKDCEFWGESQEGSCGAIDDPYMLHTDAYDFCSWGKRRTDKVTEKE